MSTRGATRFLTRCALTAVLAGPLPVFAAWFKGNTHTHTSNSDGDAPPTTVVEWFRDHGYQFVVITDHDVLTDVAPLNQQFAQSGRFLVLQGEEVTQMLSDPQHSAAHINGIGMQRCVEPLGAPRKPLGRTAPPGMSPGDTFTRNVPLIRDAGGLPQVNHPGFKWSLQPQDLFNLPDHTLLEIWNSYPAANNLGGVDDAGTAVPSTEELWDILLSRGQRIWAVGSDDSHNYHGFDDPYRSLPGRAWVVVRAEHLAPDTIVAALERGDFYASTGVSLKDYSATTVEIEVTIAPDEKRAERFKTVFTGRSGKILAVVTGTMPVYHPRGDEGYVRATITDSNGRKAWTQPVFLDQRDPSSTPKAGETAGR